MLIVRVEDKRKKEFTLQNADVSRACTQVVISSQNLFHFQVVSLKPSHCHPGSSIRRLYNSRIKKLQILNVTKRACCEEMASKARELQQSYHFKTPKSAAGFLPSCPKAKKPRTLFRFKSVRLIQDL